MSRPSAGEFSRVEEDWGSLEPDCDYEDARTTALNGRIPNGDLRRPELQVDYEDERSLGGLSQGSGDYDNRLSGEVANLQPDYLHPMLDIDGVPGRRQGGDYLHPISDTDGVAHHIQGKDNLGYVASVDDYYDHAGDRLRRRQVPVERADTEVTVLEEDSDSDRGSVDTYLPHDPALRRTLGLVATMRITRRTRRRKSAKRQQQQEQPNPGNDVPQDYEDLPQEYEELPQDYDYVEEVGLPSMQAYPKTKTLADKLQEVRQQGTSVVANTLRDSIWDFDTSLRGTAWKRWKKWKAEAKATWKGVEIWSSHFKEIEGKFGSATVSYFRFTRWLVYLNLFGFLLSFVVIIVPYFSTPYPDSFGDMACPNNTECKYLVQANYCSKAYAEYVRNQTVNENVEAQVVDFIVGTGWMERTILFYGNYYNRTFHTGETHQYNMGLAYLLALGFTFFLSLIFIILNSSQSVKEGVLMNSETVTAYFNNSVFCGWDFCIVSEKSATVRKKILSQEFKVALAEQAKRLQQMNRTKQQMIKLYALRLVVNVVVVSILAASLYLVYFTMSSLLELQKKSLSQELSLVVQYLPSVTITLLNIIVPLVFNYLVSLEDYRPITELRWTLFRTVLLRLASLGALVVTLYYTLHLEEQKREYCPDHSGNQSKCCGNNLWFGQTKESGEASQEGSVKCWETYVGQQFYKLSVLDFAVYILFTFLIEFPRKSIYDHLQGRFELVRKYGAQEFDIPKNVLDLVYSQTLSWCGMFFTPLLPGISFAKCLIIFFVKKVSLMNNYVPPQSAYNASKANSFFMSILLLSFIATAAVIGYMIGNINPSKSCGPFRVYSVEDYTVWRALIDVINSWPNWIADFLFFLATPAFFIPAFGVLCFVIYCYWTVGQGYKKMQEMLSEHLKMEGRDKHFLLARVDEIVKKCKQLEIPESLKQSTSIKGQLLMNSPGQSGDVQPG